MQAGFDEILTTIKTLPTTSATPEVEALETRRRCMEVIQEKAYAKLLANNATREQAFLLFKEHPKVAEDFLLYPAPYRPLFLEELLQKQLG
jgi:hypothetical protein